MIISFLLNGKEVSLNTPPERRTSEILREDFGLLSLKGSCYKGECGRCAILLNGDSVLSCLLPVFALRGCEVMTFEGIVKTREYSDLVRGFRDAGYTPCPACEAGRVVSLYSLLDQNPSPGIGDIISVIQGTLCDCGDYSSLIQGVLKAAGDIRKRKRARKK